MNLEGIGRMKPRQLELGLKGGSPLVVRLVKGTRDDPLTVNFGDGTKAVMWREDAPTDDFDRFSLMWKGMLVQVLDVLKDSWINVLRVLKFKFSV